MRNLGVCLNVWIVTVCRRSISVKKPVRKMLYVRFQMSDAMLSTSIDREGLPLTSHISHLTSSIQHLASTQKKSELWRSFRR